MGLALLASTACESEDPPSADGGVLDAAEPQRDAGSPDAAPRDAQTVTDASAADAHADASVPVIRDAEPFDGNDLRDASDPGPPGNESVRGTALEGIEVRFPESITLCSQWREGNTIDQELAGKAIVTLRGQPRPSLGSGDLSHATLTSVEVLRGPTSGQQWSMVPSGSALVQYEVRPQQGGATSVWAEIEHDLGPAGVLSESLGVYRAPGDTDPVDLESGRYEHSFAIRGHEIGDATLLGRCEPPDELDRAIHVLVGQTSEDYVMLTRFARTTEAFAGSAPVHLQGLDVRFSDPNVSSDQIQGFWAMTYAAEHHNWNDSSRYDFTGDLAHHERYFEPWRAGEQTPVFSSIERVDVQGIDGFGTTPAILVSTRDFGTGALSTRTFNAGRNWLRVDSKALLNQMDCSGPNVFTLTDYGERVFQVMTCERPEAPGFSVEAVVPIFFREEPTTVGQAQTLSSEGVTNGRPNFVTRVGRHTIEIAKGDEAYFFVTIKDANGQPLAESIAEPFELWPEPRQELIQRKNDAQGVELSWVRRWLAPGVGESSVFAAESLELKWGGDVYRTIAWDRLDYENTHHNWNDTLTARTPEGSVQWKVEFLPSNRETVRVTALDGTVLLEETEVVAP